MVKYVYKLFLKKLMCYVNLLFLAGRKKYVLCIFVLFFNITNIGAQTVSQFNGEFDLFYMDVSGGMSAIIIKGNFSNSSSSFNASDVLPGDRVVDYAGSMFEVVSVDQVNGATLDLTVNSLNSQYPQAGVGIIYRPSSSGYPLVTSGSSGAILAGVVNTSTISIDADMPDYSSGSVLPASSYDVGDVIKYTVDMNYYQLTNSGWQSIDLTSVTMSYDNPVTDTPDGNIGDMVVSYWDNFLYVFDGTEWVSPESVSSLPTSSKFGDVFYNTTDQQIYMMNADGGWVSISGSSGQSGSTVDQPISADPGTLYYNTDEDVLYVYTVENKWVEVSTNGSVPGGIFNPDPASVTVNGGDLFYNTSDNRLYMYNGTSWVSLDNFLPSGQIYVGNTSNVATPVTMKGDATINNSGTLTIGTGAVTETKLDKANITLNGFATPIDNVEMGDGTTNYRIVNLANPTSAQDAATKNYVDLLFSTPSSLALPMGNFYVGNAVGKAASVAKSSIPISGFGSATAGISMGDGTTNYKIGNMANPTMPQDAATKYYVDNKILSASNITLPTGNILVGSSINTASAVAKNTVPFSDFGAASADVSMGSIYRLTNLADPTADQDAATKKYVDNKIIDPSKISLGNGSFLIGNSSWQAEAVAKNAIPLSGFAAATADVSLGGYKLTDVATPLNTTDAATKGYIDNLFASPNTSLALPEGNLFMGDASGKAKAAAKNTIPVSAFGTATGNIAMGNATTQYNINFLADPLYSTDAATKNYVDTQIANPGSMNLAQGNILVGNAGNKAEGIAPSGFPLSNFGAATSLVEMGNGTANNRIIYLADPTDPQDAATKKYVDQLFATPTSLALATGTFFVGDASGKAASVSKNSIPISGFGNATADVLIGDGTTNYKITNLADPTGVQDAVTKSYVDNKVFPSENVTLPTDEILVGNATNTATAVAKNTVPFSDFGAAAANISMGGYSITNLADPASSQDAATKNYVDTKIIDPNNIPLSQGAFFVGNSSFRAVSVAKNTIPLSGFAAAAANVSLGNYKLTNLATPTDDTDGANKGYVDGLFANPGSILALPAGNFFVGNASGNAEAVAKNTIPVSGFASAAENISLGDGTTNYKITHLADPADPQDAATKNYVDTQIATSANLNLADGNIFVGGTNGKAAQVTVSGDATMNDAGALTIADDAVTAAKINANVAGTGLIQNATTGALEVNAQTISGGTLSSTDLNVAGGVNATLTDVSLSIADDAVTAKMINPDVAGTGLAQDANGALTVNAATILGGSITSTDLDVAGGNNATLTNVTLGIADDAVTDAKLDKSNIPLSGFASAEADVSLGNGTTNYRITNLADPATDQEAATKSYVDTQVSTSANLNLANGNILIGDASGKAAAKTMTGDATMDNTGLLTIADDAVTAAKINADVAGTGLKQNVTSGALEVDVTSIPGGAITSTDLNVTGGSNATLTDVTLGIADGAVTDAKLDKANIPLSGFAHATADIEVGDATTNYKILNLKTPASTDAASTAATKGYVDNAIASLTVAGSLYQGTVADAAGFLALTWATVSAASNLGSFTAVPKTVCTLSTTGFTWIAYPEAWDIPNFFYRYDSETYAVFDGFQKRIIPASETGSVDYQLWVFKTTPDRTVSLITQN